MALSSTYLSCRHTSAASTARAHHMGVVISTVVPSVAGFRLLATRIDITAIIKADSILDISTNFGLKPPYGFTHSFLEIETTYQFRYPQDMEMSSTFDLRSGYVTSIYAAEYPRLASCIDGTLVPYIEIPTD